MAEALKAYDKYVVCLDKTPEQFEAILVSLLRKAIDVYENRAPELRHGLALDRHVTIILSQSSTARPLCGIYFNLHSPYQKEIAPRRPKRVSKPLGGSTADSGS